MEHLRESISGNLTKPTAPAVIKGTSRYVIACALSLPLVQSAVAQMPMDSAVQQMEEVDANELQAITDELAKLEDVTFDQFTREEGVRIGDHVFKVLPNGKKRTLKILQVGEKDWSLEGRSGLAALANRLEFGDIHWNSASKELKFTVIAHARYKVENHQTMDHQTAAFLLYRLVYWNTNIPLNYSDGRKTGAVLELPLTEDDKMANAQEEKVQ